MTPVLETIEEKRLIGVSMLMCFADFRVSELWRRFMAAKNQICNSLGPDLFSVSNYPPSFFTEFHTDNPFEKWAALEVADFTQVPPGMETYIIPAGLYAVFNYKGLSSDNTIFRDILNVWLPDSAYILDERPHFEILGDKYKNNDPESEEEIWIPIKAMVTRPKRRLQG